MQQGDAQVLKMLSDSVLGPTKPVTRGLNKKRGPRIGGGKDVGNQKTRRKKQIAKASKRRNRR